MNRRLATSLILGCLAALFVIALDLQTKDPTGIFRILIIPGYIVGAFVSNSIHKPNEPVAYVVFALTLSLVVYLIQLLVHRWRR